VPPSTNRTAPHPTRRSNSSSPPTRCSGTGPPSPLRPGGQAPFTATIPATPAVAQTPPRIRPAAHRRRPRLLAALSTSSVGRVGPTWTLLAGSADCPDHVPHGGRCSFHAAWGDRPSDRRGGGAQTGPRGRCAGDGIRLVRRVPPPAMASRGMAHQRHGRGMRCESERDPGGRARALGITTVPSWEAGGSGHAYVSDQIDGGPPAQIERLSFTSTAAISDHGTLATGPP
jgi:hypothetical protein